MMLAIEVEYLLGRCVATRRDDRTAPEWPPHPGRLFSALVATFGERGSDPAERDALLWLERLDPPSLHVAENSYIRDAVPVFVPVNDSTSGDAVLPRSRPRKPRHFPTAIPHTATMFFLWPLANGSDLARHRPALEQLVHNLTYLGHSSSLVRAAICDTPPPPTLRPADGNEAGDVALRVVGPGRLQRLLETYELSQQLKRRIEPPLGAFRAYVSTTVRVQRPVPQSVFGETRDWFVFRRVRGPQLPLHASVQLTTRLRAALQVLADQPPLEILSGHRADGRPSGRSHVACLALPYVDHRYADGSIMGLAVVLPREVTAAERRHVLRALQRLESLRVSRSIEWILEREHEGESLRSLQPNRYLGLGPQALPACRWASVTPMIFGHFPRDFDGPQAARIVTDSCKLIGLPAPARVRVSEISAVLGAAPSTHFATLSLRGKPIFPRFDCGRYRPPAKDASGQPARLRAHVEIEFAEPVRGPVVLGAGRFLGMGLCLPRWERQAETADE